MKLHLQNFKCYTDKEFCIDHDRGLILLSGESGKGKSSILQAINFVLFGTGIKVVSHGKKSCSVTMTIADPYMKVHRTKGPNRLIVNDILHDDEAQQFINNKYGTSFELTGYIPQMLSKSFILLSPSDKLSFLEQFVNDVDITEVKQKCKLRISELSNELIECSAKLKMSTDVFLKLDKVECPIFPIHTCKKNGTDRSIMNENTRYKNSKTLHQRELDTYSKLNCELNSLIHMNSITTSYTDRIEEMTVDLSTREEELGLISVFDETILIESESYLDGYLKNKKLISLQSQLHAMELKLSEIREQELCNMATNLSVMEDNIWSLYETKDEFLSIKQDTEELFNDSRQLHKITKQLTKHSIYTDRYKHMEINDLELETANLEKRIKRIREFYHVYACPVCENPLKLQDDTLIKSDTQLVPRSEDEDVDADELEKELGQLKEILFLKRQYNEITEQYETGLPHPNELKYDIDELIQYEHDQNTITKQMYDLRVGIKNSSVTSVSYKTLLNDVISHKSSIQQLQSVADFRSECKYGVDEYEIKCFISDQRKLKHRTSDLKYVISDIRTAKDRLVDKINICVDEHTKKFSIVNPISLLETQTKDSELQIEHYTMETEKHAGNLLKISDWKIKLREYNHYMEWKGQVELLTSEERLHTKKYEAVLQLKDLILQSESITIGNFIKIINTHAKVYLDYFFEDNNISVVLSSFKQNNKTGSKKPEINLVIDYKGMDCDLYMLSGGEIARIVLAFTLALCEIFRSPLLMLDECTSSLDEEMTSHVFDVIKDNLQGVLVIIVAHQVVTGVFDQIIYI